MNTRPENLVALLHDLDRRGIRYKLVQGVFRAKPCPALTPGLMESLAANREGLSSLLRGEDTPQAIQNLVPSPVGMALLMPYKAVILAAQSGLLPSCPLTMNGQAVDANAYITAIAEPIYFGETLEHPRLLDWLENLRRLQIWYFAQSSLVSAENTS